MPHGVHAKDLAAFRLDPDLRARLKAQAEKEGVTMTAYVSEAIEEKMARGITTSAAPPEPVSPPRARSRKPREAAAPAARFVAADPERPQPAPRKHAVTCKCGICRPNGGK
jgi:hypothetical protein